MHSAILPPASSRQRAKLGQSLKIELFAVCHQLKSHNHLRKWAQFKRLGSFITLYFQFLYAKRNSFSYPIYFLQTKLAVRTRRGIKPNKKISSMHSVEFYQVTLQVFVYDCNRNTALRKSANIFSTSSLQVA